MLATLFGEVDYLNDALARVIDIQTGTIDALGLPQVTTDPAPQPRDTEKLPQLQRLQNKLHELVRGMEYAQQQAHLVQHALTRNPNETDGSSMRVYDDPRPKTERYILNNETLAGGANDGVR